MHAEYMVMTVMEMWTEHNFNCLVYFLASCPNALPSTHTSLYRKKAMKRKKGKRDLPKLNSGKAVSL